MSESDLRDDLDRAHGIVHACRDALVTTLRTKSFASVRAMIGSIDEWKKQYAVAEAVDRDAAMHVCCPTTEARFQKIRGEADRLHLDDSTIRVNCPLGRCADGWRVGFGPETDLPLSRTGATLDEALDALIAALAELRFTITDDA